MKKRILIGLCVATMMVNTANANLAIAEKSDTPELVGTGNPRQDLLNAAISGTVQEAWVAINTGAPVDALDTNGRTPLMWAVLKDRFEMVDFLLSQNAKLDKIDNDGYTIGITAINRAYKTQNPIIALRLWLENRDTFNTFSPIFQVTASDMIRYYAIKQGDRRMFILSKFVPYEKPVQQKPQSEKDIEKGIDSIFKGLNEIFKE